MKTKRIIWAIIFSFWAASSANAAPGKLGLSAPLSGPGAGWGNDIKNVLTFANDKLAGGEYTFVFEDDRCDPKTSLSVAQKLTKIDQVKTVFIVCGQTTLAAASIYRRADVTVMAPLATPSRISELGVFRTSLNDIQAARKLAEYVAARHQRIFVLTEENDYPVSFVTDFIKSAEGLKLEVINEGYQSGTQDFRPQLLRIKSKNADAIFLNTHTEEALEMLVRQLKELRMTPKIYGAYLPGSANFLKNTGALADGTIFVDFPGATEFMTEEGKKLMAEYEARFGPINGWSFAFPATFEGFRAVNEAIKSGRPMEEYLHQTTFKGIFGEYTFNQQGDLVGPQHVLRIIRNGQAELVN